MLCCCTHGPIKKEEGRKNSRKILLLLQNVTPKNGKERGACFLLPPPTPLPPPPPIRLRAETIFLPLLSGRREEEGGRRPFFASLAARISLSPLSSPFWPCRQRGRAARMHQNVRGESLVFNGLPPSWQPCPRRLRNIPPRFLSPRAAWAFKCRGEEEEKGGAETTPTEEGGEKRGGGFFPGKKHFPPFFPKLENVHSSSSSFLPRKHICCGICRA